MKAKLQFVLAAFLTAATMAFLHPSPHTVYKQSRPGTPLRLVIRCSPDWNSLQEWLDESDIPPIPGAGSWTWKISTKNDSAQFYFNQGMNMYYSFHIIEGMASFKKAARFDPKSAMLYWAQALTYGPNINDNGYTASPEALQATKMAIYYSKGCSAKEKKLINAMMYRYSDDSSKSRSFLNQLYTDKMKEAYVENPADGDVAALYADAMMLQHPWDLWNNDGTPKTWTPPIRTVLEKLLTLHADHPGANHYYIHVMEASPFAYKAIPAANRLGKLTPGLSHTVHMPSHIYLRTGQYNQGTLVNEAAVKSYEKSIPLFGAVTNADFLYVIHNLHMQTNLAMLSGRSSYASSSAAATVKSIKEDYLGIPGELGNYIQYIYMTPMFVDIRFGNWDNLLRSKQPAASMIYANILWHFGRGIAFSHQQNASAAELEITAMLEGMKDSSLLLQIKPFSPALDGAKVAVQLVKGSIALAQKNYKEAISAFEGAVKTEEDMVYNEPRDWLLNPRHFLADALIKSGQPEMAYAVLEKDLKRNQENGWALFGSWQALMAQHKTKEAASMLIRFRKAFDKADLKLSGPVF